MSKVKKMDGNHIEEFCRNLCKETKWRANSVTGVVKQINNCLRKLLKQDFLWCMKIVILIIFLPNELTKLKVFLPYQLPYQVHNVRVVNNNKVKIIYN